MPSRQAAAPTPAGGRHPTGYLSELSVRTASAEPEPHHLRERADYRPRAGRGVVGRMQTPMLATRNIRTGQGRKSLG